MHARLVDNPFKKPNPSFGGDQLVAFDPAAAAQARADMRECPVYKPTPLISAPGMAQYLGVKRILIKDEGQRLPLKSFKALGATYALSERLRDVLESLTGTRPSHHDIFKRQIDLPADLYVVAATDGNHGRALAWGAHQFGVPCRIYLPRNVSQSRADAIAELGAELVFFDANYDETLQICINDAAEHGWLHIQDTSQPGLEESHKVIMEGYSLMGDEIVQQLPTGEIPSHLFIQVGCGGMAAALTAFFWNYWGTDQMKMIGVQSVSADPLVETFEAKARRVNTGRHETLMVGIACGEIATLCERLLYPTLDAAMAIRDETAMEAMRLCAARFDGDPAIVAGETGCAGLAGLITALRSRDMKDRLGLSKESSILIINSEGETDPEAYKAIMGCSADDVLGSKPN